jgi:hypothetical protein
MYGEISSRYERLYRNLKGMIERTVEREHLKPDVAEDIFHIVSLLPHPRIASIQDIP